MANLGFVGLGVMGGRIAKRLLDAGHAVTGYNRTRSKALWLLDAGMSWADSPRDVAEAADVTFSMVSNTEALLAITTFVFLTSFAWSTLYGALQSAVFFLVLAMGLGALFKSEAAGGMVCAGVLTLALITTALRISPFFNIELSADLDAVERMARLVQNRIGYVILTLAVMLLTFGRAEQRERMLSG